MGVAGLAIGVGMGVEGLLGASSGLLLMDSRKKAVTPDLVNGGWQIALVTLTVAHLS